MDGMGLQKWIEETRKKYEERLKALEGEEYTETECSVCDEITDHVVLEDELACTLCGTLKEKK